MFRTEQQRARACRTLMDQLFVKDLWTNDGPTEKAIDLLQKNGEGLSSGERVLFLAAWELWNSTGQLRFADLLRLDDAKLHAVGSLLVALAKGGGNVDDRTPRRRDFEPIEAWIRSWSEERP
jgi:hypothetical protein